MEHWKEIEGTDNKIYISDLGRVKSILRDERILKIQTDSKGYQRVSITINRIKRTYKVHREVAKAFIDNPEGLPQVNHIDGNKSNNTVSNLEWVSNIDNAHHAIANGLWKNVYEASLAEDERRKTPITATCIATGEKIHFGSVAEAERAIGSRHISDVIKGKRSQAKGYYFERG